MLDQGKITQAQYSEAAPQKVFLLDDSYEPEGPATVVYPHLQQQAQYPYFVDYVRAERRPFLLEAMVSRLYGHSSSSGANFVGEEVDCVKRFEEKLEQRGVLTRAKMDELRAKYTQQLLESSKRVIQEPQPRGEQIWEHVYYEEVVPPLPGMTPVGKKTGGEA